MYYLCLIQRSPTFFKRAPKIQTNLSLANEFVLIQTDRFSVRIHQGEAEAASSGKRSRPRTFYDILFMFPLSPVYHWAPIYTSTCWSFFIPPAREIESFQFISHAKMKPSMFLSPSMGGLFISPKNFILWENSTRLTRRIGYYSFFQISLVIKVF